MESFQARFRTEAGLFFQKGSPMKKLMKLTLAAVVLAGSLAVGSPVKLANAASICQDLCCDPSCTAMIRCYPTGGKLCLCEAACPGYDPEV